MARRPRSDRTAHRHAPSRSRQARQADPSLYVGQHSRDRRGSPMTFRSRLLIAFALATIVPLAILGVGVRRQLTARLVAQHQQRVNGMARVAAQDVERESASIASRLSTLAGALRTDDRFRMAAVRGDADERS